MPVETNDTIATLLSRPLLAVIATNRVKGGPQLSLVWFYRDGDVIAFSTTRGRAKYKNITRNPGISLLVENPDDGEYVTATGQAEFAEDERRHAYEEKIVERYLTGESLTNMLKKFHDDPDRVIVLLHVERFVLPNY